VQAFAAGAALCSTSLGTTFTVLGSSGLSASRLGVVLTSAAMMDDVVGLVMVQVISNLGGKNFNAITIVRPVLVSVAFAVVVPLACLWVLKPVTIQLNRHREAHPTASLNKLLSKTYAAFTFHTALLVALIAGATYAGTSNLFAAWIAGAVISWWDSEVPHVDVKTQAVPAPTTEEVSAASSCSNARPENDAGSSRRKEAKSPIVPEDTPKTPHEDADSLCGAAIYEKYYAQAVSRILQPIFFASIGFSIPITRMFRGAVVWRGVVYTVLMALAKMLCGLWLVRLSIAPTTTARRLLKSLKPPAVPHFWGKTKKNVKTSQEPANAAPEQSINQTAAATPAPATVGERRSSLNPPKPLSIHPPLILALAMCARGEIGFLISGVAESNGIFSASGEASHEPSDIFLVVTWAIVLCTIIGPLGVGLSVRRVKKLQKRKNTQQEGAGRDVLGVWGVE
jgi:Kef-type K+ transport system membrane component KefB